MQIREMITIKRTFFLGVAVTAGGLIAAGTIATLGNATAEPAAARTTTSAATFPTNAFGQTYGSADGSVSTAAEPDLIDAYADDGKTKGYVRRVDLEEPLPKSTAEALAAQAAAAANGRKIPVYGVDGKTVLGTFTVQTGTTTTK